MSTLCLRRLPGPSRNPLKRKQQQLESLPGLRGISIRINSHSGMQYGGTRHGGMPHRPLQKTFKDVGMVGHDPPTYMEGKAFLLSVLPPLEA